MDGRCKSYYSLCVQSREWHSRAFCNCYKWDKKSYSSANAQQPVLTPLLIIAHKHLRFKAYEPRAGRSRFLSLVWVTALCALIITFTLSKGDFRGSALSVFAVVPQLFVYIALLPEAILPSQRLPLVGGFRDVVHRLCWRAVATLTVAMGIQTTVFGFTRVQVTHVLFLGVAKAMTWFFLIQTVRDYVCVRSIEQEFKV
jgi:hypothetical protein